MKKEELKIIVSISVAIAAAISIIYLALFGKEMKATSILRAVSFGITISTFFWGFYLSVGWKWSLFNKIFYRPNLNGTWSGQLVSDWKDEHGQGVPPIEFFIIIRQSFLRIHFTTLTDTFVGVSYAETFSLNKDKGLKNIAYLYRKDTSQGNDDHLREGATELRLIISETNRQLEGKYWSNTKTQGSIKVSYLSEKHVDAFIDAKKLIQNG